MNKSMQKTATACCLILSLLLSGISLNAQTVNDYRTKSSGAWRDAAVWEKFNGSTWVSTGLAPVISSGVTTIRSGHTVLIDSIILIGGEMIVNTGGDLHISSGVLTVNNGAAISDAVIDGSLVFTGGSIAGEGSMLINGQFSWSTVFGNHLFTLSTTLSSTSFTNISGNYAVLSGTIINNGTFILSNGSFGFNNSFFINNGSFTFSAGALEFGFQGGTPMFTNSSTGTINKTAAGEVNLGIAVTNNGTLKVSTGTLTSNIEMINGGILEISSGTTFQNKGTLLLNAGTQFTGLGTFAIATGNTFVNTALTMPPSVSILYTGGTVAGTGNVTVNGSINWNTFAGHNFSRPLTISNTATLTISGSSAFLSGSITNNGIINWTNGIIDINNGTLTNNVTFTISNTATDFRFQGGSPSVVNSATGTVIKTTAGECKLGFDFINNGTIQLSAGTLVNNLSFTNTGTVAFTTGTTFLNNGTFTIESGTNFTGSGNLNIAGGPVNINTNLLLSPTITLNYTRGTITGTGSATVNGLFNWNTFAGHNFSRPLTISNTATLTISGSSAFLSGSIINNGSINWTNGIIDINNGSITNNATFTISNTATDFRFQGGSPLISNSSGGTITKTTAGICVVGFSFSNAGIIKGIGTFQFNLTFTNTGIIEPGLSPGILKLNGTAPFSSGSTLKIELAGNGGAGNTNGHDQLQREGNLSLNGTLTVIETNAVADGSYIILQLSSGTMNGTFTTTNLPAGYTLLYGSTTVTLVKSTVTAIADIERFGAQVKVFPNPVTDRLIILNNTANSEQTIKLTDIAGKEYIRLINRNTRLEIDMTNFSKGVYMLLLEDKSRKITGKKIIIKQ